jgi:L-methionine (R)-S-oxide reductase
LLYINHPLTAIEETMPTEAFNLNSIVKTLGDELNVDVCSLYTFKADTNQLTLAATHGLSQSVIGATMSIKQGLTGAVARTRHSLSVKNPSTHPDYFHIQGSGEEKYQSYLGIPLIKNEVLFGVLVAQTVRPKMFFMSEIQTIYAAGYRLIDIIADAEGMPLPQVKYAAV